MGLWANAKLVLLIIWMVYIRVFWAENNSKCTIKAMHVNGSSSTAYNGTRVFSWNMTNPNLVTTNWWYLEWVLEIIPLFQVFSSQYKQDLDTNNISVIQTSKYFCEIFHDSNDVNNCKLYDWWVQRWGQTICNEITVNEIWTKRFYFLFIHIILFAHKRT